MTMSEGLPPLFFCHSLPAEGESVALDEDESRHALSSRRLADGDRIALFDGQGTIAQGQVDSVGKPRHGLKVCVISKQFHQQPSELILASAIPKGDRMSVMLDMATQLGMTQFIPLSCGRSVVKPKVKSQQRWSRICSEACKQSRRAWLPTLSPPVSPGELAQQMCNTNQVLIAHPVGLALREVASQRRTVSKNHLAPLIMIGPEGGFTDDEVTTVTQQGGIAVSLGQSILRIETAAVTALALLAG
ncbi:MAG TPA: 16S rRNA (uracil(1498)-N(3))-methyltransferase [Acidiferrobacteraceae bacterium]|nr:16S rRNA (uracil(1498)-N(3))-methyltransferase [Acidiferrobacteraceae bacterium]